MTGPNSATSRMPEPPQAEAPPPDSVRASYMALRALDLTCETIDPAALPEPYRQLLDHSRPMTPTLEAYFGQPVTVEVLSAKTVGGNYVRKILMKTEDRRQTCEWAVIWIALSRFGGGAREAIFQGGAPFGRILAECGIRFHCNPVATFRVTPDAAIRADLELGPETDVLYGRRNQILDEDGHLLADAFEVLPPLRAES